MRQQYRHLGICWALGGGHGVTLGTLRNMGVPISGSWQGPFPAGLCWELGLWLQQWSIRRCFIRGMIVTLVLWGELRGTLMTMMSCCTSDQNQG